MQDCARERERVRLESQAGLTKFKAMPCPGARGRRNSSSWAVLIAVVSVELLAGFRHPGADLPFSAGQTLRQRLSPVEARRSSFAARPSRRRPGRAKAWAQGEATGPQSSGDLSLRRVALLVSTVAITLGTLFYGASHFEHWAHLCYCLLQGSSTLTATLAGGAAGALHTLAGPDHLAALAPLVTGGRRSSVPSAFFLGSLWGSGHATGQVLLGLAFLAARCGFAPKAAWATALAASFGQFAGGLLGVALISIGLLGFREVAEARRQGHEEDTVSSVRQRYGWATYATGVAHGVQPDALVFIAPALALPVKAAVGFVVAFGVGTLLSMGGCAVLLALLCRGARRAERVELISTTAASVALVLGVAIFASSLGLSVPFLGR